MNELNFKVQKQTISCSKRDVVADGQAEWVKMNFDFAEDWKVLDKTVQIKQSTATEVKASACCCGFHDSSGKYRSVYSVHLGTDSSSCFLPQEIESGEIEVSVFGYDTKESSRATTVPCKIFVRKSGFVSDGATPIPPTKDLYEQLIDEIDEKTRNIQNGHDGKDGTDGFSPTASVEETESGAKITITDKSGTTTAEILDGRSGRDGKDGTNGVDGKDGSNGTDGFSPIASVAQTETGAQIKITDKSGTTTASVFNGVDGKDGKDGVDGAAGISPTVSIEKTDTGATISITDVNGTTTADLMNGVIGKDGKDGTNGKDGVSPAAKVTQTAAGATITVTDAEGTTTAEIKNGVDGKDGEKGEKGDTGEAGADGKDGGTPAISVYSSTATNYQLKIVNADGTEIITPNLMGKSSGEAPAPTEKLVFYNSENFAEYANKIYVYNGYKAAQNIDAIESLQEAATAGEKLVDADHAIDINQAEFGWANLGLIINTKPVTISNTEMILTTANVSGTATEKIYFIPESLITATTAAEKADAIAKVLTADTVDSQIAAIDNSLIHTGGSPLTVAKKLTEVSDGTYYIALSAHSDNSRPIYYNIWLQE